jgi:hypothetical protein
MTETDIRGHVFGFMRRDETPPHEAGRVSPRSSFKSGAITFTLGEPKDSTKEPLQVELLEGLEVPLPAPYPDFVQIIANINNPELRPVKPRRPVVRTMAVLFSALSLSRP